MLLTDTDRLLYQQNLQINYCNGVSQPHPLVATIACPSFQVSEECIDFETTFVTQEVHHLVTIVNLSGSDTWWKARVESI